MRVLFVYVNLFSVQTPSALSTEKGESKAREPSALNSGARKGINLNLSLEMGEKICYPSN